MTVKETVDVIRESALWNTLTIKEKVEALAHAMETVECRLKAVDNERNDLAERIGEIFED